MIWFTSDWHLGHYNIIKSCNRPFKTVEEMDKIIIDNCFELIKSNDTLYFLGDMSMKRYIFEKTIDLFIKNKINLIFIKGNHDVIRNYYRYEMMLETSINGQYITMCHYPMISWNKSHYGSWLLYGHTHNGNIPLNGKMMNVGIDKNNFKPINFDQIKEYMDKQPNNWNYIEKSRNT